MRAVVQRVARASVEVEGKVVGRIGPGLLVYLGVAKEDTGGDARYMAEKIAGLRVFPDNSDRMNLSVVDVQGAVLAVSQFTLLGDCRKGRRPGFDAAAEPAIANELYELFCSALGDSGITVERGVFRANMQVESANDGPVTILLDTQKAF
ncbi:MAG TPA: D-aminoacyl-tRNA deacylase [Sedimentisphaerales bacterium]|nr:D-aminoacyl-tRNA deacylase [Sedimentisphaerales bacterium]